MPLCIQELHAQGLEFPVLIGGAAINRDFGLRALYPDGKESDDVYEPRRLLLQGRLRGPRTRWTRSSTATRARRSSTKTREAAVKLREKGPEPEALPTDDDSVRSAARDRRPVPEPPFWGAREIDVDLDEVFPHLDTHVLFKLHWGGRA